MSIRTTETDGTPGTITLDELKVGQAAVIEAVEVVDALSQLLLEMGIIEGETVRLLAVAPLGDPLELGLRQQQLSIRRQQARRIRVRLLTEPT